MFRTDIEIALIYNLYILCSMVPFKNVALLSLSDHMVLILVGLCSSLLSAWLKENKGGFW